MRHDPGTKIRNSLPAYTFSRKKPRGRTRDIKAHRKLRLKTAKKEAVTGLIFFLITLIFTVIAYILYQAGQPGTVEQPQPYSDFSGPSQISLYTPPGVTGNLTISYTLGQGGHDVQKIDYGLDFGATKNQIAIITLQGSALYQSLSDCCRYTGTQRYDSLAAVKELKSQVVSDAEKTASFTPQPSF